MKWHQKISCLYLIANPVAKAYNLNSLNKILRLLKEMGLKFELFITKNKGDAEQLCRELSQDSAVAVFVIGGDGTLNEAINGLVGTDAILGFIPSGTTNVAAKEFGIVEKYKEALLQALDADPKRISIGKVNNRYFLLMLGAGFDGFAVYGINQKIKRLSGKGAYIFSGAKIFLKNDLPEIEVIVNENKIMAGSVVIANTACYGGKFKICPDATVFDNYLDVCIFKGTNRMAILRYVLGIIAGYHLKYSDVIHLKAEQLKIIGNTHMQIDGDYLGLSPAEVKVVPEAISFLVPSAMR